MKKLLKKVGKVIENVITWVVAVLVGASIVGIPVAVFMLLFGGVLKMFGVM